MSNLLGKIGKSCLVCERQRKVFLGRGKANILEPRFSDQPFRTRARACEFIVSVLVNFVSCAIMYHKLADLSMPDPPPDATVVESGGIFTKTRASHKIRDNHENCWKSSVLQLRYPGDGEDLAAG